MTTRPDTVVKRPIAVSGLIVAAALASGLAMPTAQAQDYPTRPITLVVPFPPGGSNDAMARLVADKLATALGQPVIVDNRGGGGGTLGMRAVATSAPDGYTLLLAHSGTLAMTPFLMTNPGYDPKQFSAVGLIAAMPIVIMAHPSVASTIGELVKVAQAKPETIQLGTPTLGTGGFMSAQLFKIAVGADLTVVAYKGTAALTNDLVGGHVPVGFNQIPPALGNIQAGKIRALAVAAPQRSSLLPDVPTTAEVGMPDMDAVLHYGIVAPAGVSRTILAKLSAAMRNVTELPDIRERVRAEGGDPMTMTPDEYAADIDRDVAKWSGLIRKLGLKID